MVQRIEETLDFKQLFLLISAEMTFPYHPKTIEKKWQKIWKEKKLFKTEIDPNRPKYYILDMFPYPSGAGLHVGHVVGYTGTDILARHYRRKGFNVLHPMGWDSFGLPAEQYAIRTGTHPAITTKQNIETYRRQLESLGFSYDWDRELATSDPAYYKWTQWIFTLLVEKGLAYEAEVSVNYCSALGTVLANEEVEEGRSKEGGYPVERLPLKQWILKITAYADRLLADLDLLDWPESIKKLQANWIGKSEGALISFQEEKTGKGIEVFTTRPDTIFAVTFLVLAAEHPLISEIVREEKKEEVSRFQKEMASTSDLERTDLAPIKKGVFTGAFAAHPITGEKIPIWIGNYVLMSYGTGSVMGVPGHDERDQEFASRYDLPVRVIYEGEQVAFSASDDLTLNGLFADAAKEKVISFLEAKKRGKREVRYKLRDWLFSRQRYWGEPIPILHFSDGTFRTLQIDELPLTPPPLEDYKPAGSGKSPLSKVQSWVEIIDPKTGKKGLRETNTMPQWAGSCWYYLRFCDPTNQEKAWDPLLERYWMPVDLYVGGIEHAVLHLLYARFWHKVLYDLGLVSGLEPFKTLRNQGLVTAKSYKRPGGGYVEPKEVTPEMDLIVQVDKMSKSKLNGVSPDEVIEEYGADSLRLYEMFMGPFEKEKVWSSDAVSGCRRFLSRLYDLVQQSTDEENDKALALSTRLLHTVIEQTEKMEFNTAIAKMMEFINEFSSLPLYPKRALKMAVQALYPFAPHAAEEMWELLGEKDSLTYAPLPFLDPELLIDRVATYVVQVNGKLRGRLQLPVDLPEEEVFAQARKEPEIAKYLTSAILKTIFVPNKLLNVVVQ
jgi:leucyl-tRNA synthetase